MPLWDLFTALFDPVWFGEKLSEKPGAMCVLMLACAGAGWAARSHRYLALAAEWVSGKYNLDGVLGKWAHGTMPVDRDALVKQSELIALIIAELWSE